jgi:L-fuculose-phosphate aldolase
MKPNLAALKKSIIDAGARAYTRGYIAANDGNISARIDARRVLITPSGISKGFLTPSDFVVVDMDGGVHTGAKKPSSELPMHLRIYRERPDVHSVCHMHPPHATAFAVAGVALDQPVLSEVLIALGSIPLVEYGTPGTEEFYKPLIPLLPRYDAFLLANHGALTVGSSVLRACETMETLEHTAHIVFLAERIGKLSLLTHEQVEKLYALRKKFGIRTDLGR